MSNFLFGVVDCKSYLPRLTFFSRSLSLIILGSVTYYTRVLCVVWQIYNSSSVQLSVYSICYQLMVFWWWWWGEGNKSLSFTESSSVQLPHTKSKQSFSWQFFPFPFLTNIPSQKWHSFSYTIFFLICCRHTLLFRLCVALLLLFAFLPWKQQQQRKERLTQLRRA